MASRDGCPHAFKDTLGAVQLALIETRFKQLHLRTLCLGDHGKLKANLFAACTSAVHIQFLLYPETTNASSREDRVHAKYTPKPKSKNLANDPNPKGIDPHHFLGGGMCREEATSAYLATLLDQSSEFRSRFLQLCGIQNIELTKVEVERECRDITLSGTGVEIIIENKISAASKTEGQLLRYYTRLKEQDSDAIVHAVYLSPARKIGTSEVQKVTNTADEVAVSIAWEDLHPLIDELHDIDATFAKKGLEAILRAIANKKVKSSREYTEAEEQIRSLLAEAEPQIQLAFSDRNISRYATELWSNGEISFCLKAETISSEDSLIELALDYKFRLRLKAKPDRKTEWKNAKRWYNTVVNTQTWQDFSLATDQWMSASVKLNGNEESLSEALSHSFIGVLNRIESEALQS